jgi:hypothetical protein
MASTYCFRDAQKLDMLIGHASTLLSGQCNIRIWDAGYAHGLESYTLAMEHTQKIPEVLESLFEQVAPNAQLYRKMDIPTAPASSLVSGLARRIDPPDSRSLPHRGRKSKVVADK